MVGVERPVLLQVRDVSADHPVRGRDAFAVAEVTEVQRLRGGHQLDAQDAVRVLEDLLVLERRYILAEVPRGPAPA